MERCIAFPSMSWFMLIEKMEGQDPRPSKQVQCRYGVLSIKDWWWE